MSWLPRVKISGRSGPPGRRDDTKRGAKKHKISPLAAKLLAQRSLLHRHYSVILQRVLRL